MGEKRNHWHAPWYLAASGWNRFFKPRFVLPSSKQVAVTCVVHFGLGSVALLFTGLRSLGRWRARTPPRNILLIGRYHLGDVLMTLPALRLVRRELPDAHMTLVVQERYRHELDFQEITCETTPEIEGLSFWAEIRAWQLRLRQGNYDTVVFHRLTRPDFPAVFAAFLEGIPHRIGGAEKGLQAFLTDLYFPASREPVVWYHWNLVQAWLQQPHSDPELQWPQVIALPPLDKRWDLLLAPFAQHTKEWPVEHWHALLSYARERGLRVALSAVPKQAERAAELLSSFPEVENLALRASSLKDLFAHVSQARCIIAVDTGIRHVAAALGVPCVVLGHGREHYRLFGTYVSTERYLFHSVPCAPCGAEPCPLGHLQCVRGITVHEVLGAVRNLISDI
jgi:ADP-heptose:LPS heptosyltransferase